MRIITARVTQDNAQTSFSCQRIPTQLMYLLTSQINDPLAITIIIVIGVAQTAGNQLGWGSPPGSLTTYKDKLFLSANLP